MKKTTIVEIERMVEYPDSTTDFFVQQEGIKTKDQKAFEKICRKINKKIAKEKVNKMDKVTDGLKHDGGKYRLDLVPPEIIEAVGAVMTHGAKKYGEGSYRNVEPKRYRAALMRHICKWLKDPHGTDEDSGLPHLWHVACNVAFLLELDK